MPPDDRHPITVEEALRLPALRIGVPEVVAGAEQLSRPIRWVHAGEIPDLSAFLKGGELVLTTGMGMPHDGPASQSWLRDLDECGIAGLVIELGSSLDAAPAPLVAEAERLGLPLIVLHRQIPFVEATETIHRRILAHQTAVLEQGQAAYVQLAELMVDGATTAELLQEVAALLDAPVVLARASGAILFQASHLLSEADVASLWESRTRGLDGAPNSLSLPIRLGGDSHWAELGAISVNGPLSPVDAAVLERAVPCVAMSLRRERESHALVGRARGEFLYTLAHGEQALSEREALARASRLSFDRRSPWLLPIVATNSAGHLYEEQWDQISTALRGLFRKMGKPALVGLLHNDEGILLVAGLQSRQERGRFGDSVAASLRDAAVPLGVPGDALQVSVGAAAPSWVELRQALRDTLDSSEAALWRRPATWHDVAAPDVRDLLVPMRNSALLERFVARLAPIIDYDRQHQSQFVETLEAYYAHEGKADAARALHLGRQSLYKRLARIAALLDVDLDDEETRLTMQLALKARQIVNSGTPKATS
jgi:purine catabolism regulator